MRKCLSLRNNHIKALAPFLSSFFLKYTIACKCYSSDYFLLIFSPFYFGFFLLNYTHIIFILFNYRQWIHWPPIYFVKTHDYYYMVFLFIVISNLTLIEYRDFYFFFLHIYLFFILWSCVYVNVFPFCLLNSCYFKFHYKLIDGIV